MEEIKEYFKIEKDIQNFEKENFATLVQIKKAELKHIHSKINSLEESLRSETNKIFSGDELVESEQYMEMIRTEIKMHEEKNQILVSEIENMANQGAILRSMFTRQEELLRSIFDGEYGSTEENDMERELDELEEKQNFIIGAHFRWSQAELLVDCGHKQLSEAVNQWKLIPTYQDSNDRHEVAVRTRNNLVAAMQNLQTAEQYIKTVPLPYCDSKEVETLRTAASFILHDMQSQKRHQHALDCYSVTETRCEALLKWIRIVLSGTINKDLNQISISVKRASDNLKEERIKLMKEIAQKEGKGENNFDLFFDVNLTINVEKPKEPAITDDIYIPDDDFGLNSMKMPTKEEIFGKINEITAQYQDENEKIIRQMNDHKEKQGSKLQDKLAARRQRRAKKYVEEKEAEALTL